MRRIATLLTTLALGGALAACGSDTNTNNANTTRANTNAAASNANGAGRDGVIETNANIPANMNARTAPANTAVVMNDNGNKNTAGIRSINANTNHNANANHNGAAKANSNH
jgi:hypothetical protein